MTAGCILLPSAPIQKSSRRVDLVGRTLAHYRITTAIGEGGMDQVYRATDYKLGRDVALKVLPADVTSDPERLARFQREARAIAVQRATRQQCRGSRGSLINNSRSV